MNMIKQIQKQIQQCKEKTAYTVNGKSVTYSELASGIAGIQALLQANEARRPVVLYGHKERYMKVGICACLFSGIPYVPVDRSFPRERVNEIIKAVQPYLILGDFQSNTFESVSLSALEKIMNCASGQSPDIVERSENDTCYILFTSGSTGTPKGVMVSYQNLASCVKWLVSLERESACILNQAKYSFDLSVADFYLSLMLGAEHFALTDNEQKSFPLLFRRLEECKAETAVFTPSFAEMLLLDKAFSATLMPRLKTVLFCGETLKPSTVRKLKDRFKNIKIINCYGPTEATFAVTSAEITDAALVQNSLPLGVPKPGTEILLSDDGEIIIVGDTVSKGYLPPSDNTAFTSFHGKNAYYTGDYGCFENGMLYFLGRKDNQIKFSGYRIELGDIEHSLQNIPFVEAAVTAPKRMKNGAVKSVSAFVILKKGYEKNEADIKRALQKRLPDYMLPKIKIVDAFPLNENGKCDIKKLMGE